MESNWTGEIKMIRQKVCHSHVIIGKHQTVVKSLGNTHKDIEELSGAP